MKPKLSIVFVNYNSALLLSAALASLGRSEECERIVVDNASADAGAVVSVCRENGALLIRLGRNLGYGGAANVGFRYARGRYLAVANPDLVFADGAAESLVCFLEENPRAGVVAPQFVYPDGFPQPSARRFPRLRYVLAGRRSQLFRIWPRYSGAKEFLYLEAHKSNGPVEVEAVVGAFMMFRREALEEIGGFDEGYFMFAEDMDICRRLHKRGWQVFLDPRVRVLHHCGGVRRNYRDFTEYHRLKALCRFFCSGRSRPVRGMLSIAFTGYLSMLQAGSALGLREFEYSWQGMRRD